MERGLAAGVFRSWLLCVIFRSSRSIDTEGGVNRPPFAMSFPPLPESLRVLLAEGETEERFLIEGRHAVRAALEAGWEMDAVAWTGAAHDEWAESVQERGVSVHSLERGDAKKLFGFSFHRGVVAVARKPGTSEFAAWLAGEGSASRRLVILERLADPGNVGTVIRNAAAFGFDAAILVGGGASPYNAKAVRASATAIFHFPVFSVDSVAAVAAACPAWRLIGTDLSAEAVTLPEFLRDRPPPPLAVILGGEATGLSPEALACCRHRVTIPITPRVESLNVASASAILLHALGAVPHDG